MFIYRILYLCALIYWNIFKPKTCGVVLMLINDDRVLLVKHSYKKFYRLPGGSAKRNEKFKNTLAREMQEELGIFLKIDLLKEFGKYISIKEGKKDTIRVFLSRQTIVEKDIVVDGKEIASTKFFDIKELPTEISPESGNRVRELLENNVSGFAKLKRW